MNFVFTSRLLLATEEEENPLALDTPEEGQAYSGKGTSLKPSQMKSGRPALFTKSIAWPSGSRVFDIGAGRPEMVDSLRNWFGEQKVVYLPYDKFNGESFNSATEAELRKEKADIATSSNLLNVIPERKGRVDSIKKMYKALKPGGLVYITVHKQSGKQPGKSGEDSWQNHKALAGYLEEVQEIFPNARVAQGMIVATK